MCPSLARERLSLARLPPLEGFHHSSRLLSYTTASDLLYQLRKRGEAVRIKVWANDRVLSIHLLCIRRCRSGFQASNERVDTRQPHHYRAQRPWAADVRGWLMSLTILQARDRDGRAIDYVDNGKSCRAPLVLESSSPRADDVVFEVPFSRPLTRCSWRCKCSLDLVWCRCFCIFNFACWCRPSCHASC
ncbi:hypothetical protein BD289DRAFT_438198 [Coniella lustricola]|uniref:Uncharacterized protein n=1 Tax=Coniella lustricola TaxID=2025994 RepID=A0A2T3A395_9PEZI|nr:hypothetical protein BD289DRAFT_438198 [Coniella lustricola]